MRIAGGLILAGVLLTTAGIAGAADADNLRLFTEQHETRHAQFAEDLAEVAQLAADQNLTGTAAAIRELALPLDEQGRGIDRLPEEVQSDLPPDISPEQRHWRTQLRRVRQEYAQDLYLLSRRALTAGHVSFAFDLVREVAYHDPDHRLARRLLGYVRYEDHWVTPHQQQMLRKGNVWHDRFGWLPRSHVEKYELGQRNVNGRWMSADEEASIRHDFRNAWVVETDHFEIQTDYSQERGVELGVLLEEFHRFFRREFAAVFNTPQQMQQLFDGATGRVRIQRRHQVHYYQSKQEFVLRLRAKQPGIELSNGLYLPNERTTFSYFDPDNVDSNEETLVHEVTHQLLGESQRNVVQVGVNANFWLIEGIACYLESFHVDDAGRISVGDPRHTRFENARTRLLTMNFYVPLRQFTALGMNKFQRPPDIDTLKGYYSQAAGLTHFFLHYEDGLYRDALIEHLAQIYSPVATIRNKPASLAELAGVSPEQLDRQYHSYLSEMQAMIAETAKTDSAR